MVEPEKANSTDLESTVRHLREENAKLMQLLRARGLLNDVPLCSTNKSSDPQSSTTFSQTSESSSVTFDHSDHQFVNNSSSIHQQNYHGNSSSITPNFNTVIQNSTQPFVQNNTNLIQPINLVNINNVSLESIQSIFSGQNNLVYLSQSSSNTTTTTTTTTATNSSSSSTTSSASSSSSSSSTVTTSNSNVQESTTSYSSADSHQISIRPKPSLLHPHQELVPVVPKIRAEQYESITRQYSSSSITNETSNLLDNDSNDSKQKYPRPIRPKPSSRSNSLQLYKSMMINETHSNPSPTVSLFSSSPTSTSNSFVDQQQQQQQQHSSNIDETSSLSSLNNGNSKKSSTNSSNKNRSRNRTKTSTTSSTPIPIAPNFVAAAGRPLAPAPVNVQRSVTSNNPITKRSNTSKKRPNKSLIQCHSESLLSNVSSPTNTFADSISGFLEDFNQELLKSNILSQDSQTTNLLTDESTTNSVRTTTLDNIDLRNLVNGAIQRHESYQSTLDEYPTEQNSNPNEIPSIQEFHSTENEPIGSFMSEEDMRFVEMNFDENTFLKHFDLDDAGLRLNVQSDQNLFSNLLTNSHSHSHIEFTSTEQPIPATTTTVTNTIVPISTPTPSMYSGSSLINNNVFTTVVPLGSQQQSSISSSSSSHIKTTIINQTNLSSFLPEEGVQLTARHIEPRQVATYETVKYQDILDDLVMVTDQDALQHAQAAAANDPSIVSTDFTYALIEATNQIIKDPHIQVLQATTAAATTTFNDLQYFYPIEQEQELLQKQLETCVEKSNDVEQNPNESIVILEKLQAEILVSADLTKTVLDDSLIQTAITDLSSLLQLESTETLPPILSQPTTTTTTIEEIPVHRSPPAAPRDPTPPPPPPPPQPIHDSQPIDFDAFFSSEPSPPKVIESEMNTSFTDNLLLTSNPVVEQEQEQEEPTPMPIEPVGTVAPKPCILFEPILSPTPCALPEKPEDEVMVIDEGSIGHFKADESVSALNEYQFEALLNGETYHPDPYAMIESPQPIESEIHEPEPEQQVEVAEEQEVEEEEPIIEHPKFVPTFEYTFNRYREKHRLKMKRDKENRMKKNAEQSLTVPPVKLKLNAIFLQKSSSSQKKKKRRSKSPSPSRSIPSISISLLPSETEPVSPSPPPIKEPIDEKPIDRPPLKITIRTKLPLPPPPPPVPESVVMTPVQQDESKKIRKTKKKKSHHPTQPSKKKSNQTTVEHVETEYAGLTRFERPLAQRYHQTRPPTPDENQLKHEIQTPSPPVASLPSIDSNPIQSNPHPHSGFMIDEQTPPSSITSIEHKNSPPPLLSSQTVNEKLKLNYSHLFTYDHQHHEQQNNNTFITPPPETDFHPQHQQQQHHQQQKNPSFDNFFPFAASPSKKRHQSRKSSVTSSTSSKSLPTTEYAIDSHALEPVSPTPLSSSSSSTTTTTAAAMSSKSKHSTTSSASSTPTPSIASSTSSTVVPTSNFNEIPSTFFDSHQSKSNKDSHSSNKKSSSSSSSTSSSSSNRSSKTNPSQSSSSSSSYPSSRSLSNHSYRTNTDSSVLPPMLPPSMGSTPSSLHLDPYAQSYHHFAPRASAASFFNFPFPHPFLNPHATAAPPTHFHPHHSMKYHPAHHAYPPHHQSTYPYHPHLPRQQQYNNSNYMSSRDHHHHHHHPFER